MRILLIVLLFLISLAQIAAVLPILPIPEAPIAAKAGPIVMALGALISAFMLIRKSARSYIPYFAAYAVFLILTVVAFGTEALPKAAFGFVIGLLFFVPAVRSPR
jgi:hypothetical protein